MKREYGGFGIAGSVGKYEVLQRINHPGEVNRARPMPQNPDIIATKTNTAELLVFDRTKHPSQPPKDGFVRPEMRLLGHKEEGYGVSWNPFNEGKILSCADDGLICQWDIKGPKTETAKPTRTYMEHKTIVEDVAWHQKNEFYFASASDDNTVKIWDSRQKTSSSTISGHRSEVNAVAFSRHSEFFLLSGSKDKTVGLWDLRNPSVRLHILEGHEDSIFRVEWAPFDESLLASCGADNRVIIWDLRRIGREQAPEDAADGPPEMVFVHGGHTDKVSDMGWNEHEKWTVASVGDNNVLQCWTVSEDIYNDEVKVDEKDLE